MLINLIKVFYYLFFFFFIFFVSRLVGFIDVFLYTFLLFSGLFYVYLNFPLEVLFTMHIFSSFFFMLKKIFVVMKYLISFISLKLMNLVKSNFFFMKKFFFFNFFFYLSNFFFYLSNFFFYLSVFNYSFLFLKYFNYYFFKCVDLISVLLCVFVFSMSQKL